MTTSERQRPPLIWDLPLRLFHWALAIAVGVCLYTGIDGGFYAMDWHMISGYVVLGLLMFRFAWGVVGPRHARFRSFLRGPRQVWNWGIGAVRRSPPPVVGHNPLAGWFILLMLLILALQAVTGLFATDDIFVRGPLRHLAPEEFLRLATRIHRQGELMIGGLVALHLTALIFHRIYLRERLVVPMITGRRPDAPPDTAVDGQRILLALVLGAGSAALTWYVINL